MVPADKRGVQNNQRGALASEERMNSPTLQLDDRVVYPLLVAVAIAPPENAVVNDDPLS